MIVYISSYPRSGNSWIQQLFLINFKLLPSSVHDNKGFPQPNMSHLDLRQEPEENRWYGLPPETVFMASYIDQRQPKEQKDSGKCQRRALIMPGCKKLLNEERRKIIAAKKDIFILKTHEMPFSHFYEGEKVLHIVRHPGAAFHSYHQLLTKQNPKRTHLIEDVIYGNVKFGSWAEYESRWIRTANELTDSFLLIRYESLAQDPYRVCQSIAEFINMDVIEPRIKTFDQIKKPGSISKNFGTENPWQTILNQKQIRLIHRKHVHIMTHYGYELPRECEEKKEKTEKTEKTKKTEKKETLSRRIREIRTGVLRQTVKRAEQNIKRLIMK
ncbi:MAG: sulfotransferase domain-containing protein [Candidatus Omnitrophota bacterium]